MKEKDFSSDFSYKPTLDDYLMYEEFQERMVETLTNGMGEEMHYYLEKDFPICVILFVGGALYGEEHTDLKRVDIIGRGREFRSMARFLIENLRYPSLKSFERHEELYTQVFVHGIYFGQKNAMLDS